ARADIGQPELARRVIDEAQLLVHRIDQREMARRVDHRQWQSGESRARAHVGHPRALKVGLRSQRVEQVMREDFRRIGDRGEVEGLVPAQQFLHQAQQLRALGRGQRDAELCGAGGELSCRLALRGNGSVTSLGIAHGALRTKPAMYCCTGIASRLPGRSRTCWHSTATRRAWLGVNSLSAAACKASSAASSESLAVSAGSGMQCWYSVARVGGACPASTA